MSTCEDEEGNEESQSDIVHKSVEDNDHLLSSDENSDMA